MQYMNLIMAGLFQAAVLFLVACGLQLIFGVQKIVNLACGSFYALGAFFAITVVGLLQSLELPMVLLLPVLVLSGLVIGLAGAPLELLLRPIYRRDPSYQLLMTFGLVLMFQDVFRFFWGPVPRSMDSTLYTIYGSLELSGFRVPVYNLLVIAASLLIALALGQFLKHSRLGRIVRATAENRNITEAMGVNSAKVFTLVFALGCALGTVGGALVIPTSAASMTMAAELVVDAFAVVIIGGLGSMAGAMAGAIVVGLMRAIAVAYMPEVEILAIYLVVVAVLLFRPAGLFGRSTA
ncbi:branched-chain amino acid ABC transporter permease [Hydrogenophaga sp. XSHU_21]|jgi:branched-chain amino acid transport system permease protein